MREKKPKESVPPEPCKPCGVGGGVPDGVLNIPLPEIVLHQPCIGALVGEGEAAGMAQHVRVRVHGQAGELSIAADHVPDRLPAQRATALTDKKRIGRRFHSRSFCQPDLDHPELVPPQRVRRGQAMFQPCDVKRCRIVKDRIRLWKQGVRDLVMEPCYAPHNFWVRPHSWLPMI
jgi:hypothetical protein